MDQLRGLSESSDSESNYTSVKKETTTLTEQTPAVNEKKDLSAIDVVETVGDGSEEVNRTSQHER